MKNVNNQFVPYVCSDVYIFDTLESIWGDLGNLSSHEGLSDLAIYCNENAMRHRRTNVKYLYNIGKEFVIMNDYDKVQDVLSKIPEKPETQFYLNVLRGHLFLAQNNFKKSYTHFEAAAKANKMDMVLLLGIAKWNEKMKRYACAFKYFSLILKEYASHPICYEIKFRVSFLCKYEKSFKYAKRFLSILEKESELKRVAIEDILVQLANVLELTDEDDGALKICEQIITTRPNYIFSYRLMAWILFKNKRYQDCLMQLTPKSSDVYISYILGKCCTELKMEKKAYEFFDVALNLSKVDPVMWNSFGIMYFKSSQFNDAHSCFDCALVCDSKFHEAHFNLALTKRALNQPKSEISPILENLLKVLPDDEEIIKLYRNEKINLRCRDRTIGICDSPYFAADLFFGGKIVCVNDDKDISELDPCD